ncbi:hypothetical protein FEM01_21865 [Pseudomonas mosselii]|uniref:Uncharacterized protein n=1 Tax=Pseudomonas mosselii TaxID=78327 RepID=A0A5R8YM01_9PSED|nr:hypothetical protein FEM01_21865 [Pseudomonas mosselii]
MGFGNGVVKFLSSNLFARLAGYPAIIFSLISDGSKAFRQYNNGNFTTAVYTASGGLTMAAGSVVALEGGLAVAGATSVVPFAGWAAAGLVLLGIAIIGGGLYLHAQAHAHLHSPIELWAARSIFGNRKNDGEARSEITLDHEKKLPPFLSLQDELKAWHDEHYGPSLISAEEAQSFGITGIGSGWQENNYWAPANWTAITHNEVTTTPPTVELTVFLPGFIVGTSEWSGSLSSLREDGEMVVFPLAAACYVVGAGLILNFKNTIDNQNHTSLHLAYSPNQGLNEKNEINSIFRLEH